MFWMKIFALLLGLRSSNHITPPVQPINGPGGTEYLHDSITIYDHAEKPDGFWMYEPASPKPASAPVLVFLHGYGAYNPMVYGGWIRHLVRKGNTVIFPRYQKNLISPMAKKFPINAAKGIRDAIDTLASGEHVRPELEHFSLVGHSYGGVTSAYLGVHYEDLKIPKPTSIFLVSPGSGPLRGAVLKSYEGLDEDLKLLIMVSENDHVVGEKFGRRVFGTATKIRDRNLIRQFRDKHGDPSITAGHNECHYIDDFFDNGVRNATTLRSLKNRQSNAVDYYGYWKLYDALLHYDRTGKDKSVAFGNTKAQRYMGKWSDGVAVKELEILVPDLP